MTNGWTPERKAIQTAAIQQWKPWQKATGPRTQHGKAKVSRNAFKGGHRLEFRNCTRILKLELALQREFLDSFDR